MKKTIKAALLARSGRVMLLGGVDLGNGGPPLRAEINETEQARVMRACFHCQSCRALNPRAWPVSAPCRAIGTREPTSLV